MSSWPNVVTIGSFLADKDDPADYRMVLNMSGWVDGLPARVDYEGLQARDGAWGSGGFAGGRVIGVEGLIEQTTHAAAQQRAKELASLSLRTDHLVVVENEAIGPLQVMARVTKTAVFDWIDPMSFTYALEVMALDPFKRPPIPRTTLVGAGATVAAANDGTAAADLVVTLTSPGTVVLSAGGVTLTTGSLPAGAVIDTGATTVRDSPSGSSLFHLVTMPALWPALPAGGGSIQQAGTAGLSIEHFDTYA